MSNQVKATFRRRNAIGALCALALVLTVYGCKSGQDEERQAGESTEQQESAQNAGTGEGSATDEPGDENGEAEGASESAVANESDQSPESEDILARDPVTDRALVRHVLISWDAKAPIYENRGGQDPRGLERSVTQANALAQELAQRASSGEDFAVLMRDYSEDRGSAGNGRAYPVSADANLVEPFKALSLRLNVGEVGVVESDFGYHIIVRDE